MRLRRGEEARGLPRVLQIGKYFPPYRGGMETHLGQLCAALAPHVELEVLVAGTEPRTRRERVGQFALTRCASFGKLASVPLCPTLPLEAVRRNPELVHLHLPNPVGMLAALAVSSSVPIVVTHHSDVIRQRALRLGLWPLLQAVLTRAAAIICASDAHRQTSRELAGVSDKCVVVPFGVDARRFTRPELSDEALRIRSRHRLPLVVSVGRHVYYKGFGVLLEAVRGLECELILIGDGPLRQELEARAERLGIAERVHFCGELEDAALEARLAAADVFVLPSVERSEAFGLVQLEAMAAGVPVINTWLDSAVPQISRDGESGFTVPPKDPNALRNALMTLLGDPALRRRFGQAGRRRVEEAFSLEAMGLRTLALYERVLGRPLRASIGSAA